jgi:branched-chain amino acid transport system permease protein
MFTNLVIGGLAAGSLYAVVAIAIAIVLRVTDIANFAQGEMAMLSTFVAYWLLQDVGLEWWQASLLALGFGLLQGVVVQLVIIRPLIGSASLSAIIATLGLNIVLHSLAGLIWGHQTYIFPSPFSFGPPLSLAGVSVPLESAVNIAVALLLIAGLTALLRWTWTGLALQAASQNQTVAGLMGVPIERSFAIAWGLGGLAGSIAGILVAPAVFLDTNIMGALLIKAFAGGALGGLSSFMGVFAGCLLLGLIENLAGAYISASFAEAITFAIIIAALMVRAEGLFGRVRARKV